MADPECRKKLISANYRLDQFYLRKIAHNAAELEYKLSIKRLLLVTEDFRKKKPNDNLFTTAEVEELIDPVLFRIQRDSSILDIYNYFAETNGDKLVRAGDAALFLDTKTKQQLRVEAQFRPSLHAIAFPSLDDVAETTDAEQVLNKIELSRKSDLLPTEQIRRNIESELTCCHVEHRVRGYGTHRRTTTLKCNKKAMANNLRCPIHSDMPSSDPKVRFYIKLRYLEL